MYRLLFVLILFLLALPSYAERLPSVEQQINAETQWPLRLPDSSQINRWLLAVPQSQYPETWFRLKSMALLIEGLAPARMSEALHELQLLVAEAESFSAEAQLEVLHALIELKLYHQDTGSVLTLKPQILGLLQQQVSPRLQFDLQQQLGRVLKVNGELEQALSYFLKAHHEILLLDDAGTAYRRQYLQLQLARIQSRLQNYRYAIQIASLALQTAREAELHVLLPELYLVRGAAKQLVDGVVAPAIADFELAAQTMNNQPPGRTQMLALNNLGAVYLHRRELSRAADYLQQGIAIAKTLHNDREIHVMRFNVGYVQVLQGMVDTGLPMMEQAYEAFSSKSTLGMRGIMLGHLADAYHEAGLYRKENEALRQQRQIRDEVLAVERDRVFSELQVQFEAQEQALRIQLLEQESLLRDERLATAKRENLWYSGLITLLLLGFIAAMLVIRHTRGLNAQLDDLSKRDPLTQLFNRRALSEVGHAKGDLVLLLDVDHFKQINDRYGHDKGDAVLTELAQRLMSLVRKDDQVLRWGGEEFLLILRGVGEDAVEDNLTKICNAIRFDAIAELEVTVSGGGVLLQDGQPMQDALQQADALLYQAKEQGRCQIHYQAASGQVSVLR